MVILFSEENNIGIICEKSFDTVEKIECLNISELSKMSLYVMCLRRAKIQLPKSRNFTDVCIVRATHHKTFVKINFATLRSYTLFSFTFNLGNLTAEPCWRIFTTWSWSKTEKKKTLDGCTWYANFIQLFRKRLWKKKMRTRQSRKVMWNMINTLFLTKILQ